MIRLKVGKRATSLFAFIVSDGFGDCDVLGREEG
jgi:hypothetical protein